MATKKSEGSRGGDTARRRLRVRSVRRDTPDLKKLSRALIALATAQLEAEAKAEHAKRAGTRRRGGSDAA